MSSHTILNQAEIPFGDSTAMKLSIAEDFIRQCGVWSHFEKFLEEKMDRRPSEPASSKTIGPP